MKIVETIGLGRGSREPTELEMTLGVQILTTGRACQDLLLRGKQFHEIFFNGGNSPGLYVGVTENGGHVICPSRIPTAKYNDPAAAVQTERFEWRNEPTVVYDQVMGFRPVTGEYLESAASNFESVSHLGTYLDKDKEDQTK